MKERDGDGVIHVDCRLHFTLDDERRVAKEGNLARPASLMLIALLTMLWGNEGGREGGRDRSASGNLVSSPDNGNKPHTTTSLRTLGLRGERERERGREAEWTQRPGHGRPC